ncbi:MAG: redoxin domain-containing protein [Planctomycetaceae bacterium]|nr:redoxin domain-containing protein [Planctomycetaceae bacterium]
MLRVVLCGVSIFSACVLAPVVVAAADESVDGDSAEGADELPEGHSLHGEVFNEGPRQAAYLMDGVGVVRFDVTTSSEDARAFVRQGVAQLHGFWYFESERSFRQAAMLDPDCAIAYWGMAMSNRKNESRAKGFIEEAKKRRDKASKREQRYIDALHAFMNAKASNAEEKQKRSEAYVKALDDLLVEFPDDIEAKAFLAEFFWSSRDKEVKAYSHTMINAMIQDVLDVEPEHPVHHYRIHLWDAKKAENALESAARCGPAAPAIAHMWHMPGHIYSKLKRYEDAVWQQEASARVDHAHMMRDLVLPDQIHNFAHNNEWCIRNLIKIGRVQDAVSLARNMIELPRHPKYNHIGKSGSFKYGRQRLMDVYRTWQLHEELIADAQTAWLQPVDNETEDLNRSRYLASAHAALGHVDEATRIRDELQRELDDQKQKQTDAGTDAEKKATDEKKTEDEIKKLRKEATAKFNSRIRDLQKAIDEVDGRLAAHDGKLDEALEKFKKADNVPVEDVIAVMIQAGKFEDAVKRAEQHVRSNRNEVRPLIAQLEALWAADQREKASDVLAQLGRFSSVMDQDLAALTSIETIAEALEKKDSWRQPAKVAKDIGVRPDLDQLGPFRWQPSVAADWNLKNQDDQDLALSSYRGRPVIVIFYLGAGCLHCAEQIQKFGKEIDQFRDAGLEIVAVSTDAQKVLSLAWKDLEKKLPFDLVSDQELNVFRKYRCYDDFEKQPLHGTFLIDGDGRIRWQDISYEPFMDTDFMRKEAQRLLDQDKTLRKSDAPALTQQTLSR